MNRNTILKILMIIGTLVICLSIAGDIVAGGKGAWQFGITAAAGVGLMVIALLAKSKH